ncbi:MAG: hypothetical protein AAGF32_06755, partial [Pseudomonadota bacterium]
MLADQRASKHGLILWCSTIYMTRHEAIVLKRPLTTASKIQKKAGNDARFHVSINSFGCSRLVHSRLRLDVVHLVGQRVVVHAAQGDLDF